MAGLLSRRLSPSTSKNINVWTCDAKVKNEVITLTSNFGSRDLEIRLRSLNVELDLHISVMYMR